MACGCRVGHPRHATWAYSWISPPIRSRRRRRMSDGGVGGGSGLKGCCLVQCAVGAMVIEVRYVLSQHCLEVVAVEDQYPV